MKFDNMLAFVREVIRQRDWLMKASAHDDIATSLMIQELDGRRNRVPGTAHRRIWTRRDKRLFEEGEGYVPPVRMKRLIERYHPHTHEYAFVPLWDAALSEAKTACRGDLYAEISKVGKAHRAFLSWAAAWVSGVEPDSPWGDVMRSYDDALRELAAVAPEINDRL